MRDAVCMHAHPEGPWCCSLLMMMVGIVVLNRVDHLNSYLSEVDQNSALGPAQPHNTWPGMIRSLDPADSGN